MFRVRLNGAPLYELMLRENITQNELAKSLGMSSGYLSQLMTGKRCPSARMRRRMLRVLKPLEFDDLFIVEAVECVGDDGHQGHGPDGG